MQMTLPDYATRFDSLSLSACFLDLKGVGDAPRQATGFFWRRSEKVFLITNWHVVTGLNLMDGKAIGNHWVPERIVLRYFVKGASQPDGWRSMTVPDINLSLFEDFHKPYWVQHPMAYEWNVDVVALDVTEKLGGGDVFCVNDYTYPRLYHFAGSEIFVLGHALPETTNAYPVPFPIWKRGSIASEIIVPWNMRPAFLIDSRTSKGMSGSPVFARVFGPAAHGDGSIHADNILVSEFMGIYSGRLFDDENNASVGLVWHRNLIDQLLAEPVSGSRDWKKSESIQMFTSVRGKE
ncbi:hypothetical protein AAFG13_36760 [Bradyrhizobium sp. B124]|uniref:hypothetical protein n=1 Tax=Bradyrhizobium sp. B124 TaxID=3140245 RepID=UPI0031839A7C